MSQKSRPVESPPLLKDWMLLALLSIIWGSSFILIKKSLIAMDHYQMASMRLGISTLAFLPILIKKWYKIEWNKLLPMAAIGLLGSAIPAFSYAYAQTEISSSVSGLLNSMVPIFTFIIGVIFFHMKFKWIKLLGLIFGLSGAVLLVFSGNSNGNSSSFHAMFVILGTLCYAFNINIVKKYFQESSPVLISAVSFALIGFPAIIYLLGSGAIPQILKHPSSTMSLIAILVLSLVGTVIANVLYFRLAQSTSAVFASSVAYFMPIVAIIWGLLDNETIGFIHMFSLITIISGVYLIKKSN
jgi:drug/metabolite transporter (DMT)-like permease